MGDREVRKLVTVLFCDLVGFTSASEDRDPEIVRRDQLRYFDEARIALERHGGTVEKFIGDAVMAVFGVPRAHEDDAVRAVRAAVDLRAAVEALGLEARIGINTGEVVAGSGDALVTGDAVNTASRLEHAAATGEIWIGELTLRLCQGVARVEPVGPLELKGKREPVPAYRLVAVGETPTSPEPATVLVGRTDELALLRRAFDRAVAERRCHVATVLGAAGIGKSRLATAFVASIAADAAVRTGRCLSYGEGITYGPLREIFHQAGADEELERALSLETREETARAARSSLEREARKRPLVLVLEDLHWAESALLDLLEQLAALGRDAPILLLCLARPELLETHPRWGGQVPDASTLALEGLSAGQSERLLAEHADRAVDERMRRRIVEIADGNPLFLEEMLAVAAAAGDDGEVKMPSTVQAVLTARIEGLQDGEQRVAELASIEGKEFHRAAVLELAGASMRGAVPACLDALARKQLVRPTAGSGSGEEDLEFRHQLIRDAAYQRLSKTERAGLHDRFAGWLTRPSGDRGTDLDVVVGYHLEQAYLLRREVSPGDADLRQLGVRAAAALGDAGDRAFARSDMSAAANLLGRSVAMLDPGDPGRAASLIDLGVAFGASGRFERAAEVLAQAVAEARTLGVAGLEARAVVEQIQLRLMIDPEVSPTEARAEGERLIAALDDTGDDRALAKAWSLIGTADLYAQRYADMERAMVSALEHADRAGDRQQRSAAIQWLANAIAQGPTPVDDAIERLVGLRERTIEGSEADAGLLVGIGVLHAMAGRIGEARRDIERGRAIFAALGMELMRAVFAMERGSAERWAGDPATAVSELREACETLERMGDRDYLSTATAWLASALCDLGRHDEAEPWTRISEEMAAPEDLPSQVAWRSSRARALASRGERERADGLAREAVALAETSDSPIFIADALVDLAEVLRLSGAKDEARACVERAIGLFERKGATGPAARARASIASGG